MSSTDASATPTSPIPIQMPTGAAWVLVNGEWDASNTPVVYSIQASPPQNMAVALQTDPVAATSVTTPSGQQVGGMNGLGFFQAISEAGEYQITVSRSQMGQGGSFTLLVVLGQIY